MRRSCTLTSFNLPVSIDVVMEAGKEKEEVEEAGAIEEEPISETEEGEDHEEGTAQPETEGEADDDTK